MRYVIGVIAIVLIMFIALFAVFNRDGNGDEQQGGRTVNLSEYADTSSRLEYNTFGPIVAQEERRAVRISVSEAERVVEVMEGYEGRVVRRESFSNNRSAYTEFLAALERAGYTKKTAGASEGYSGFCPFGRRHTYILIDNGEEVMSSWSASCSKKQGSFGGETSTVRRLFQTQIPNYTTIVRGVRL